jgi:hypothetical protein
LLYYCAVRGGEHAAIAMFIETEEFSKELAAMGPDERERAYEPADQLVRRAHRQDPWR